MIVSTHSHPGSGASSMDATSANSSPPWWMVRLVEGHEVEHREATADLQPAPLDHEIVLGARPSVIVWPEAYSAEFALRPSDPPLELDFGTGVVVASGALVDAGYMLSAASTGAYGGMYVADVRIDDDEWLRPDTQEAVSASAVADDAMWDDDDEGPVWVSLADVAYRGGGVMGRRRGHRKGD